MISSGVAITIYLLTSLAVFVITELVVWFSERETMSMWVIRKTRKVGLGWFVAALFCVIIAAVGIWLFVHWELDTAFYEWIGGLLYGES